MADAPRPEGPVTALDLRSLALTSGGSATRVLVVPAEALTLGGHRYRPEPAEPEVRLDVTRARTGTHVRLRADAAVVGPCWRCLGDARAPLALDVSEYAAADRPPGAPFDEDLDSEYLERDRLDLAGWLRDALAEALPATILCRGDCPGLCPSCGLPRAAGPCGCALEAGDPRWAPLGPLAERLRRESGGR